MQPQHRLYFQYRPTPTSQEQLLQWQALASTANPQARSVAPERLHVTILHFGILADVYRELTEQQPPLSWDTYIQAAEQLFNEGQRHLPATLSVAAEQFALFGPQSGVLGVLCSQPPELVAAHRAVRTCLEAFLQSCGIAHPRGFMQGSPNFRFAVELRPHISLLRAARQVPDTSIQGHILELEAMPVHYR